MLNKIDSKTINYFKIRHIKSPITAYGERIIISIAALSLICSSLEEKAVGFKIFLSVLCLLVSIYALYCWRVFFILKKEGINPEEPLFFTKSANLFRKGLFLFSIISFLLEKKIRQYTSTDVRYALRADFYRMAVIEIILSFFMAVIFVEIARILFPTTSSWSQRKHYAVVLIVTLIVSVLRIISLNIISGHGII
jgi:hypothetical protein